MCARFDKIRAFAGDSIGADLIPWTVKFTIPGISICRPENISLGRLVLQQAIQEADRMESEDIILYVDDHRMAPFIRLYSSRLRKYKKRDMIPKAEYMSPYKTCIQVECVAHLVFQLKSRNDCDLP